MKELLFERQGPKQTPNTGAEKDFRNLLLMSSEILEKVFTRETKTECKTKKDHSKNNKELLQFENIIARTYKLYSKFGR